MHIFIGTMRILRTHKTVITKKNGKVTYTSTFLAIKVKNEKGVWVYKIIANLKDMPEEEILKLEISLKEDNNISLESIEHDFGKHFGAIYVINEICKKIGFHKIFNKVGTLKQMQLSLFLIMSRILIQGSRLEALEWSKDQAIEEVLGLKSFTKDDLYNALKFLSRKQSIIEKLLFKSRNVETDLFLYDVTSSYFEGTENYFASFGYNRDKKKGKKQVVIGLLTDKLGYPVSIETFTGNTSDTKTVLSQLNKLKENFNVDRLIFVGDCGMIKSNQISDINQLGWNYITSITKAEISKLISNKVIKLELFDKDLMEVEYEGIKYILRKNEYRENEIHENRESKIEHIKYLLDKKNLYLSEHKKASAEKAKIYLDKEIDKIKLSNLLIVQIENNQLKLSISENELKLLERLDGCYVIKTDATDLEKETIHDRYKDLSKVEWAFRSIKTGIENIRPIFLRNEETTRGHVFVCMLAYFVVKYIHDLVKKSNFQITMDLLFDKLNSIEYIVYKHDNVEIKKLPSGLPDAQTRILEILDINLPKTV